MNANDARRLKELAVAIGRGRVQSGIASLLPPVALVAGASRGLGLLIAGELLDRGHRVVICARTRSDLDAAADQLACRGEVRAEVCDVRDASAVKTLVADVQREVGPIDVAITVAGVIAVEPAETVKLVDFQDALDTMLWGPIHVTWAVLPQMRERARGRLGVVTSIGGKVAAPHLLAYSTAKHAAVGFSEGLTHELAGSGVTMTTIVPGLMRTGSHERAHFGGDAPAEYAWFGSAASLPVLSMGADRAARRIVVAVLAGRSHIVLTPLAQLGMRLHGLAPGLAGRALSFAARRLPDPVADLETITGRQAAARLDSSLVRALTTLGSRAAVRNNERSRVEGPGHGYTRRMPDPTPSTGDPVIVGVPPETPEQIRPSATGVVVGPVEGETNVVVSEEPQRPEHDAADTPPVD